MYIEFIYHSDFILFFIFLRAFQAANLRTHKSWRRAGRSVWQVLQILAPRIQFSGGSPLSFVIAQQLRETKSSPLVSLCGHLSLWSFGAGSFQDDHKKGRTKHGPQEASENGKKWHTLLW